MTPRCTVLVCGDVARRDDGAAIAAIARLAPFQRSGVRVRVVGQLQPDDLIEALADGRCVVVDAVRGVQPGRVVEVPLGALSGFDGPQPASSHALPVRAAIGLAEALGADVGRAGFVGIGGSAFDLGFGLSPVVEQTLDRAAAAIDHAIHETEAA
jgi:hydrogenase maturation protease